MRKTYLLVSIALTALLLLLAACTAEPPQGNGEDSTAPDTSSEAVETEAPTEAETESSAEPGPDAPTETSDSRETANGEGTEAPDGTAEKGGCRSALSAGAPVTLLAAAWILRRRKEEN